MIQFWRVSEVCDWLKSIDLAEYRQIFMLFEIGGDRLLHLDKEQLKVRFIYMYPLCMLYAVI